MIPPHSPPPPGCSSPPPGPRPSVPWFEDPLELDRHLDGEGSPAERAARDTDVAARPEVRARLEARTTFLTALAGARALPGPAVPGLGALEARVRLALVRERTGAEAPARAGRWARPLWVGAAAALAGIGVWLLAGDPRGGGRDLQAEAVAMAAQVLHWKPQALGTCSQGVSNDVHAFVLVRDGDLQVSGCAEERSAGGASVAALRRPEDLPVVGYVALPGGAGVRAKDEARYEVGLTELEGGRVVVFDVVDHGRRVYLAVNAAAIRVKHAEAGERWTCAACHGPARQALPSPHHIVIRKGP